MLDFRITVDINAPPDRVWAVMRDIERWPEWTPTVRKIRRLDNGSLAVGSRARIWQPKLPPAKWRVTELDDARRSFRLSPIGSCQQGARARQPSVPDRAARRRCVPVRGV